MKYLNIIFRSNPNPITIPCTDESDVKIIFDGLVDCKVKKITTYILRSQSGDKFIDPTEIAYCDPSDKPLRMH